MKFIIGLVDDEENQLAQIRRTIKTNAPKGIEYDFITYELSDDIKSLVDNVFGKAIHDIKNNQLSLLIIDYKIMIQVTKVEGTDILKKIQKLLPQFPVIILTDVIDDCISHNFVDPDKVYRKSDFFKLESEYSKNKTANIFRNMERYDVIRSHLEINLNSLKSQLVDEGANQELYNKLIETEKELDEYIPIEQTEVDKVFDSSKMKEMIELLEKADTLLEE